MARSRAPILAPLLRENGQSAGVAARDLVVVCELRKPKVPHPCSRAGEGTRSLTGFGMTHLSVALILDSPAHFKLHYHRF